MNILIAFFAIFAINAWYLIGFRSLMTSLEKYAPDYWARLGSPNSFSGSHISSLLSNLYSKELTQVADGAAFSSSVKVVRFLFPITFVLTGLILLALARLLA